MVVVSAASCAAARRKVLLKWADLIEANAAELAVLGGCDKGTEISMGLKAEPGSAAATIRYYAEALDKTYGEIAPTAADVLGLIHREPVGVVGAIIPWNFPMMIGAWKLAPALAMGNSVVLKPAETASLSPMRMADLALEAGLPPGVLGAAAGHSERGHRRHAGPGRQRRVLHGPDDRDGRDPRRPLAQTEVFGPVLAVTPFDTEAEAVALANSTVYGLAGAAWTANLGRAHRMVRAVRTGVMHVNTYGGADGTVPLGGGGKSGNGRTSLSMRWTNM